MEEKHPPSKRSKPILDDVNETVRFVREQPPEHCLMKVECLSVLQNALTHPGKADHLDSTEFNAGGYTWVLSVYPNGNKEEDGDGYLSLYVKMVDKLSPSSSIYVALRFLVYDQLRDNYLTVLDIQDKRFHALKSRWGISKFLPLESFRDAANGFVLTDCCVFGAEVFVRDGQIKKSILSILESKSDRSYTWRIDNFSDLNNNKLTSPVFSFGEWSWKLRLFPRGEGEEKGKNLSLYLELDNPDKLSHGSKLFTEYWLCIKNQNQGADHKKNASRWFSAVSVGWGYRAMLSISDLHNTLKGFLVDDTLVVEVRIEVLLLLNDMEDTGDRSGTLLFEQTVRFVREQPPEHCIMKIDCFSVLQDAVSQSRKDHLDSTEFKAGGYTWVLSVYPNGNEEEDGEDHLSLYVKMVDKLSPGISVNVALRFLIYDQIRDNYLTVLDIRDKRFHALKATWGISKCLPLESFKDAVNGFVLNDCCVLGAEVLFRDGQIRTSALSIIESKSERSYTWRIENFSDFSKNELNSPVFSFGEWSCVLQITKLLIVFISLAASNWFSSGSVDWGFESFLSISDLHNTSKGFLVNDTLVVEVRIDVMLLLNEMESSVIKTIGS
ncbi:uncharacterized protein LOC104905076 [Beta vulgaris subsp. vulgaris]|uniref:uncharacterized protein LOC104905076 n=1 Tax=Beta vulgaris subsp. vulgaris TaxID=3555 RepID=UPI0020368A9E|nr:uncharacterized protein LOC104905076 [Beta vulgaris subsp. vulgaris]